MKLTAEFGNGYSLRTWDDGFGPLWLYVESLGPVGVVRATTFEDAYSCVVDEIMDDGDEADAWEYGNRETGELSEGYHFRDSGIPSNKGLYSPIAAEDLNGSMLYRVTKDVLDRYGVRVRFQGT